jgi:hypothetical protein
LSSVSPRNHRRNSSDMTHPDFLRSCFLCKRRLVPGRDIYMYKYTILSLSLSLVSKCFSYQITHHRCREVKICELESLMTIYQMSLQFFSIYGILRY